MQNCIVPFENLLLPVANRVFDILLPRKSDIVVKKGNAITVNDILASYEEELPLESIEIDEYCKVSVLQGELITPGTTLATRRKGTIAKSVTIKSAVRGIVDLKIRNYITIRQEAQKKNVSSGVSGVIETVDYPDYIVKVNMSGAGFVPLYSCNLLGNTSGILEQDSNIRLLTHSGNKGILWDENLLNKSLLIVDYLTDSDFSFIYKNLNKLTKGLIVLTTEKNKKRATYILRKLDKVKGKRLFIQDGMIFSSVWKSDITMLEYAKLKVGTLVDISSFNKSLISGKISSFKGDYALVETDEGKHRYEHYLNLLKK